MAIRHRRRGGLFGTACTHPPVSLDLAGRAQTCLGQGLECLGRVVLFRFRPIPNRPAVHLGCPPQPGWIVVVRPPPNCNKTPPCFLAVMIH
jgi:hypothetical protein